MLHSVTVKSNLCITLLQWYLTCVLHSFTVISNLCITFCYSNISPVCYNLCPAVQRIPVYYCLVHWLNMSEPTMERSSIRITTPNIFFLVQSLADCVWSNMTTHSIDRWCKYNKNQLKLVCKKKKKVNCVCPLALMVTPEVYMTPREQRFTNWLLYKNNTLL